jgi:diaminopimelate decarboxylase
VTVPTELLSIDDESLLGALAKVDATTLETSAGARRVVFSELIERAFARVADYQRGMKLLRVCYSVKTNPSRSILSCANRHGLFAEVISPAELDEAIACGFQPSDVVYNGPYPAERCRVGPGFIFADSVEAYTSATRRFPMSCVGARVRPPGIMSRFGTLPEELGELAKAIEQSGRPATAISFHVRPGDYGLYTLRTIASAVIDYAQELERRCSVPVTIFDIGGGKRPLEFDAAVGSGDFEWIERRVRERLPHVQAVFVELAQALVTSGEGVIGSILEVRRRGNITEAVIDAGYPEVPQVHSFEHRLFHLRAGNVRRLIHGTDRLLGRTCLEYDVISSSSSLSGCRAGDAIAIADAGAYDASMSFGFAQGERR